MPRDTLDHAPDAPAPIGPYSVAASAGNGSLLFLSGQTPIDPRTGLLVHGDIGEQTRQVFRNLQAVLMAAELSLDDVVKVDVSLTTMDDFTGMNEVYEAIFDPPYPARTTVAVHALPLGARIEIEMIAARPAR